MCVCVCVCVCVCMYISVLSWMYYQRMHPWYYNVYITISFTIYYI